MGNAITLPVILTSLQNNCGCSAEEAADFIHAMTEAIIDGLSSDGTVVVKGVGEFRIIDSGTEKTVEFRPVPCHGSQFTVFIIRAGGFKRWRH